MSTSPQTIDQNSRNTDMGIWIDRVYNPEKQVYENIPRIVPFSINPTAPHGPAIRVEIIPRTLSAAMLPDRMPIDDNSQHVAGALTDDVNEILTPLSVDLISGIPAVRLDVTIVP